MQLVYWGCPISACTSSRKKKDTDRAAGHEARLAPTATLSHSRASLLSERVATPSTWRKSITHLRSLATRFLGAWRDARRDEQCGLSVVLSAGVAEDPSTRSVSMFLPLWIASCVSPSAA